MVKAKSHPDQFGFSFDPPAQATLPGALAGLEVQVAAAIGMILNSDSRSRNRLAADLSDLLGETISDHMLNAWSSPARTDHRASFARLLALVQVTGRHDILDQLLRPIGAALLVGAEVHTAQIGQLELQIAEMQRSLRDLKTKAPVIRGGTKA